MLQIIILFCALCMPNRMALHSLEHMHLHGHVLADEERHDGDALGAHRHVEGSDVHSDADEGEPSSSDSDPPGHHHHPDAQTFHLTFDASIQIQADPLSDVIASLAYDERKPTQFFPLGLLEPPRA